ncbi:hypothetical protein KAU11_05705, partial [Candidatus Babeliales bacterium]|nr:hypothetical protein [Candidatus Babeliales bacterium]
MPEVPAGRRATRAPNARLASSNELFEKVLKQKTKNKVAILCKRMRRLSLKPFKVQSCSIAYCRFWSEVNCGKNNLWGVS